MSHKNPRIHVTFEDVTVGLLSQIAQQQHKSLAGLVRELALEALELREDLSLSNVATQLDKKSTKTVSHKLAWK